MLRGVDVETESVEPKEEALAGRYIVGVTGPFKRNDPAVRRSFDSRRKRMLAPSVCEKAVAPPRRYMSMCMQCLVNTVPREILLRHGR